MKHHTYNTTLAWTGNDGEGTRTYTSYRRDFTLTAHGKPPLLGSSDPAFRGDPTRYNPEELLVASLSSCHMLWYLHLCSAKKITVLAYTDNAEGTMEESPDGSGQFTRVLLRPSVVIASGNDPALAASLHDQAHHLCYIARSMNFPVHIEIAETTTSPTPAVA